jgi:hypothetical protein
MPRDSGSTHDQPCSRHDGRVRPKLAKQLDSLEAGIPAEILAARIEAAQREKAAAEAVLAPAPPTPKPLTIEEVVEALTNLRTLPELLETIDQAERRRSLPSSGAKRQVSPGWQLRGGEASIDADWRGPGACRRSEVNHLRLALDPLETFRRTLLSTENGLRRFWLEFDVPPAASAKEVGVTLDGGDTFAWGYVRNGVGVTGVDLDDCFSIVSARIFNGTALPAVTRLIENVDVSTLGEHVLPNMEPPIWRGIWFPRGFAVSSS